MALLDDPTTARLRSGRRIELTREPTTEAAQAFVGAVVAATLPHRQARRPVGVKGLRRWHEDVGLILGGLLKAGLRGDVVAVQRRTNGDMWTDPDASMGCDAFWTKTDAMTRAGLVGYERGTRTEILGQPTGQPSKLWPLSSLIALAAEHGVTAETLGSHWALSKAAQCRRPVIVGDPIVLRPWKVLRDGYWRDDVKGTLPVPEADMETAARMRAELGTLNKTLAAAEIQGVIPPVFRRTFVGDLRIGGRFFTVGGGSFSNAGKAERRAMTINGEAVAEVDIRASQLTIFLKLTDPARLDTSRDPYAIAGLPRDGVKAFLVQTFGTGRPIKKWSEKTKAEVGALNVNAVSAAVLDAYPTLCDIPAILPQDLRSALPADRLEWAAGQHLVALEAAMLAGAVGKVLERGCVALPLHDGLVVPRDGVEEAQRLLGAAFVSAFGTTAHITAGGL